MKSQLYCNYGLITILNFLVFLPFFQEKSEAQVFSSTKFSEFAFQSVEGGVVNSVFDSKSKNLSPLTLDNKATISNWALVYFSPVTEIRLSFGKTQENSGSGNYFLGTAGYLIHNFPIVTFYKPLKIPLSVLTDFTSWRRKGENNSDKFEASSIGLQSGLSFNQNWKAVQVFATVLIGAGFGISSVGYETGSEIRGSGSFRTFFPELWSGMGISVAVQSEFQRWSLGGKNGELNLVAHQLTAGVCW